VSAVGVRSSEDVSVCREPLGVRSDAWGEEQSRAD
jgi:hypothetical protein